MKLERNVLDLEIYGQSYKLKMPSYAQFQNYADSLKPVEGVVINVSFVMKTFLEELGLPGLVFDQLEIGHISDIMEAVTKKKS